MLSVHAFISVLQHPIHDGVCLIENLYRPIVPIPIKYLCYAAIAELFTYLPKSKANPRDIDTRQRLQVAAWMSLWPLKGERHTHVVPFRFCIAVPYVP